MNTLDATLKVIIDGQAYLYARFLRAEWDKLGHDVTPERFEAWEDDWKIESAKLINTLLDEAWDAEEEAINRGDYTDGEE